MPQERLAGAGGPGRAGCRRSTAGCTITSDCLSHGCGRGAGGTGHQPTTGPRRRRAVRAKPTTPPHTSPSLPQPSPARGGRERAMRPTPPSAAPPRRRTRRAPSATGAPGPAAPSPNNACGGGSLSRLRCRYQYSRGDPARAPTTGSTTAVPSAVQPPLPGRQRPGQVHHRRRPARAQHPVDLGQRRRDRVQVAEDEGREHRVERGVGEGQVLPVPGHPAALRVEVQHRRRRVEGHHPPGAELPVGRPGPGPQVEHPARRQVGDGRPPPGAVAPQRQDPVHRVVAPGDAGEDLPALHGVMRSMPTQGRSTSGTTTLPSACW